MVSAEAAAIVAMLEDYKVENRGERTIEEERAALEAMSAAGPLAEGVKVTPASADGVPAEWIEPAAARELRQIVYFHGGGYAIGSLDTHRGFLSRVADMAATNILSVDYRLAPECPFPAGLDDAMTAITSAMERAEPGTKTVIGGDSAGGGLSLATLLRLKDEGRPLPDAAVVLSAWTDLTASGESVSTRADADPMLEADRLDFMAERYLQGVVPAEHPHASPLFGDLRGLPPIYLSVGDREVLLDDSTRFAERSRSAGVDTTLAVADDMWHVFPAMVGLLPEADAAVADIVDWLDATLS